MSTVQTQPRAMTGAVVAGAPIRGEAVVEIHTPPRTDYGTLPSAERVS